MFLFCLLNTQSWIFYVLRCVYEPTSTRSRLESYDLTLSCTRRARFVGFNLLERVKHFCSELCEDARAHAHQHSLNDLSVFGSSNLQQYFWFGNKIKKNCFACFSRFSERESEEICNFITYTLLLLIAFWFKNKKRRK